MKDELFTKFYMTMDFCLLADRTDALPLIARWYFGEWGHEQEGNSLQKTCERIRGKLNRDKAPLHVLAVEGEQVLGVGQLKLYEMDMYPDKEHWLGGVFVRPESRGKGVASGVALKVAEVARSFGVKELFLQTERLDGGLYAQAGWTSVERAISRGDEVLVMVKTLEV